MSTQLTDAQIIQKYKKEKEKRASYMLKRRIWSELMVKKAKEAKIEVTDAEVQAEIKARKL